MMNFRNVERAGDRYVPQIRGINGAWREASNDSQLAILERSRWLEKMKLGSLKLDDSSSSDECAMLPPKTNEREKGHVVRAKQ
jgi:hypothetical protein